MDGLSLEDEFEIRQTLATYCMGIDRKDRALIRQCFARDIKAHYIDLGKWNDAETLADYMIEGHAHYPATMHQVTTTLFAVHQGAVTAQTYVQANLFFVPQAQQEGTARSGDHDDLFIHALGYYNDVFIKEGGRWVISEREFKAYYISPNFAKHRRI